MYVVEFWKNINMPLHAYSGISIIFFAPDAHLNRYNDDMIKQSRLANTHTINTPMTYFFTLIV